MAYFTNFEGIKAGEYDYGDYFISAANTDEVKDILATLADRNKIAGWDENTIREARPSEVDYLYAYTNVDGDIFPVCAKRGFGEKPVYVVEVALL